MCAYEKFIQIVDVQKVFLGMNRCSSEDNSRLDLKEIERDPAGRNYVIHR